MENKNEMSPVMIRYFKNKNKYNKRAKKYFNEIYYPQHKEELLIKGKEYRLSKGIRQRQIKLSSIKQEVNNSLIVSFD